MDIAKKFEALGMRDTMLVGRQVESFAKEHYRPVQQILSLMGLNHIFDVGKPMSHAAWAIG